MKGGSRSLNPPYFLIGKNSYNTMKEKAANGDSLSKSWIESFFKLGNYLNVKV